MAPAVSTRCQWNDCDDLHTLKPGLIICPGAACTQEQCCQPMQVGDPSIITVLSVVGCFYCCYSRGDDLSEVLRRRKLSRVHERHAGEEEQEEEDEEQEEEEEEEEKEEDDEEVNDGDSVGSTRRAVTHCELRRVASSTSSRSEPEDVGRRVHFQADAPLERVFSTARQPCRYGERCYRTQPEHREQFSHPGDADYLGY
eukprot:TRINITY_DN5342_c1_g2_i1.p1 TRINITY_DN5342_c1_g2~~TRINITY_DN5342_c1_g2_i1.p1  ORF type:complete len:227 (-),score=34.42 TRINITY_DN5342_c1_g2_i1:146-742(-)